MNYSNISIMHILMNISFFHMLHIFLLFIFFLVKEYLEQLISNWAKIDRIVIRKKAGGFS